MTKQKRSRGTAKEAKSTHISLKQKLLFSAVVTALMQVPAHAAYDNPTADNPNGTSVGHPIGDLEIYASSKPTGAAVMMMVDTSRSMGVSLIPYEGEIIIADAGESIGADYGWDKSCVTGNEQSDKSSYAGYRVPRTTADLDGYVEDLPAKVTINGEERSYELSGCKKGNWNNNGKGTIWVDDTTWGTDGSAYVNNHDGRLTRLSRLKHALIQALGQYTQEDVGKENANGDLVTQEMVGQNRIADKHIIGIGQYPHMDKTDGAGVILVPAKPLTAEHRQDLYNALIGLRVDGGTPISRGYTEAAAYMLGKKPQGDKTGYEDSDASTKDAAAGVYKKPASGPQYSCYGKGIFFLTDGQPLYTYPETKTMMNNLLPTDKKLDNFPNRNLENEGAYDSSAWAGEGTGTSGWKEISQFSQALRNHKNSKEDLLTATIGFGADFDDIKQYKQLITNKKGQTIETISCDKYYDGEGLKNIDAESPDAKKIDSYNLCKLGEEETYTKVDGKWVVDHTSDVDTDRKLGGGGFTAARSSKELIKSLQAFLNKVENDLETAPSGTILVPQDPFRGGTLSPYAYMPVIEPQVGKNLQVWSGNLKKYATRDSTLYGYDHTHSSGEPKARLYTSLTLDNPGGKIKDKTADLWAAQNTAQAIKQEGNSRIDSGGFYAQLLAPDESKVANTRKVFVESYNDTSTGSFINVTVNADGKPLGFNKIKDDVYGGSTDDKALRQSHRKILNFMGYNIFASENDTLDNIDTDNLNMKDHIPEQQIRVLGSVIHSKPSLVSYSAEVNEQGRISTKQEDRDDYLLFGTTDGALHLVDAESGKEKWSLILQEMFRTQPEALVYGSSGKLKFGIDAPWLVNAKYNYEATSGAAGQIKLLESSGDTKTKNFVAMAAYGGFRLGARGLYALELTDVDTPKVLFNITAKGSLDDTTGALYRKNEAKDTNSYKHIGHIWSKPTMGRTSELDSVNSTDVIIFGGGYDMRYEDPNFQVTSSKKTLGRHLYIANAQTGEKIFSWENPKNHSIVGGITALDRNNDGFFDHLYFADMGGNLFRADFVNKEEHTFENVNVTRVFAASPSPKPGTGTDVEPKALPYRFYNRPVVSFYKEESGKLFALINVASGDRSSPLSSNRLKDKNKYANRVYGIIDRDITRNELLTKDKDTDSYPAPELKDLQETDLVELGGAKLDTAEKSDNSTRIAALCPKQKNDNGTYKIEGNKYVYSDECKQKVSLISEMLNIDEANKMRMEKSGWYYPLTRFAGFEGVSNVKSVGEYEVIASKLYISAYDLSTLRNQGSNDCSAKLQGATEVQLYCLPYGMCMDDSSITGTGGFLPAGAGIQELTLGAYGDDDRNVKVMLGTSSSAERKLTKISYGDHDSKEKPLDNSLSGDGESKHPNYIGADQKYGDGIMPDIKESERYVLDPKKWYEVIQ